MLTVSDKTPARSHRRPSPLAEAIKAHRAALKAAHADPEDDGIAEHAFEAEQALIAAPCSNDTEFFRKMEYLLRVFKEQYPRGPSLDSFDPIARAVDDYLSSRKAA